MDSPYKRELEVAYGAVQAAAKLSERIIKSDDKGVVQKEDFSPVTIADFAIQALLTATIKSAFPEDAVVGEEDSTALQVDLLLLEDVYQQLRWIAGDGDGNKSGRASGVSPAVVVPDSRKKLCSLIDECSQGVPSRQGRTWIFDPIDGTKTYVRGELYAINVALLVDGKQALGVVGCPNLHPDPMPPLRNEHTHRSGCIVYATKGHGAFVRPLLGDFDDGTHRQLDRDLPQHGSDNKVKLVTCAVMSASALPGVHEAICKRLGTAYPGTDLLPWVLRWVALAMGVGNTTFWVYEKLDRRAKAWDHAGAMLLFEEVGGRITDVHGKDIDLAAGRTMTNNFGFVAASTEELHSEVMDTIRAVLTEEGLEAHLGPA